MQYVGGVGFYYGISVDCGLTVVLYRLGVVGVGSDVCVQCNTVQY